MDQVPWVEEQIERSRPPAAPADDRPGDEPPRFSPLRRWSPSAKVLAVGVVLEFVLQAFVVGLFSGGPFPGPSRLFLGLYSLLNAMALGMVVAGIVGMVVQRVIAEAQAAPSGAGTRRPARIVVGGSEREQTVQVCANCGHANEPEITHCRNCGVELGRTTDPDTHPDEVVDGTSATERSRGGEKT